MMRQFIYIHLRPKRVRRLPDYTACGPLRLAVNLIAWAVTLALVGVAVATLFLLLRCST